MKIQFKHTEWGHVDGEAVELITISDPKTGFEVQLSSYGATIVRVKIPDQQGNVEDIVYGQNSPNDYVKYGGYFGAVVGRVANRVGNACFDLDGEHYELYVNNVEKHSLHGGKQGFSYKNWKIIEPKISVNQEQVSVMLEYISNDLEENYPGELTVRVTYIIRPMEISWEFFAFTSQKTIINLTNHSYWNLDGLQIPIDNQILTLYADRYNPVDQDCLPLGNVKSVKGTGIDFQSGKNFKEAFQTFGDIDNNFFLTTFSRKKNPNDLILAAKVYSPRTKREMEVWTSEPCCQLYTGNFMERLNSFGKPCIKHGAFCIETQKVPNAINIPKFRNSVILKPKDHYYHKTMHKFRIRE